MRPSFDEMRPHPDAVREHYRRFAQWLQRQPRELMDARRQEAEMIFRRVGITFAVYGAQDDGAGTERLIPFDLIPRVIPGTEWKRMAQGLRQRVTALNRFIADVYGEQEILKAGNVTLSNAIGTGIADDKSIYPYVPKMVEFYLGEKPILNNVPTHMCRQPEDLSYVLDHLGELVVKEVHGAGGYGMLVGPAATQAEIEDFRRVLKAHPENYIAQPTLALSTCPTFVDSGIAPRHIDLRPFVLSGKSVQMVPGGLTRVALKEGSLVVNSSQGGGTKDTWVLEN
jgi:uncharacterized circularly permuted ATP-grasp superfamily protein